MPHTAPSARVADTYRPHHKQLEFHQRRARFRNAMAGRRGGKTLGVGAEFDTEIYRTLCRDLAAGLGPRDGSLPIFLREPRRNYWVIAPTYALVEQARRYVFRFLPATERRKMAQGIVTGWSAQRRQLWLDPDICISFKTGEKPETLVSESLDGVWLTEAARLKPECWPNIRPGLSDTKGWCMTDTTPMGENWYVKEFWERGDPTHASYDPTYCNTYWWTEHNPFIDRAEIEAAARTMPPKYFNREYRADPTAFHGRIYDHFAEEIHVIKGPAPLGGSFRRVVCGLDYGMVSPTAFVVVGIKADDSRMVIHEEYGAGKSMAWVVNTAKRLQKDYGIKMFWCDPSAAGVMQELRNASLPASGADNDVLRGIQSVATALHYEATDGTYGRPPLLTVHASCANLIRELKTYRWKEHRQHGTMEEPADNQSDHAADAARYALIMESRTDPYRGAMG